MAETKSPEALLQDALTAQQDKNKQLETDLGNERAARGKAEQSLLEANKLAEQRSTELGAEQAAHQAEKSAHAKTTQSLADANALVDELHEQLAKPTGPVAPTATLGSGKDAKTYRFVVPQFHLAPHGKVLAKDVKSNSDVLRALVAAGSTVIELVPAK